MPATKETSGKEPSKIWVEKYRPRSVSDVAHQTQVVHTLQKSVKASAGRGDLPHLLFYGPPGTGKTSTALALCRDLFGAGARGRVLELNASDERGIKVVRDKIKTFAQGAVPTSGVGTAPPFKVIVLDEADAITVDAQTALRRTMEAHSRVTRFILICNYVSRIIGPLTSRCAKFRFAPLPAAAVTAQLRMVATAEHVPVPDPVLQALVHSSEGDLRKAINTLQAAHRMVPPGTQLTHEDVSAAACLVPPDVVARFDDATAGPSASYASARAAVDANIKQGLSALQLLTQYADRILGGAEQVSDEKSAVSKLNDLQKAAVSIVVADAEKAIIDGCDEQIQLYNAASRIVRITAAGDDAQAIVAI